MSRMSATEHRRCAAIGMAIEISGQGYRDTKSIVEAAKQIEAYLKGDDTLDLSKLERSDFFSNAVAPEPKCFTQPDPTFKNEVLNDVDA